MQKNEYKTTDRRKELMKETGSLISAQKVSYTDKKRLKEISDELKTTDNIDGFDKQKSWENIINKYENDENAGMEKYPVIRPFYKTKAAAVVLAVLFTLNLMTVIFAKTNIVTYLYDFNNGLLTVRRKDYDIKEKNTEYSRYFTSIYDGVKYFGCDIPLPHGLPSEYDLHKVYCAADKGRIVISYISNDYETDGKEISYCVSRSFYDCFEINEDEKPEVMEYNGITYYVMHNINRTVIQWVYNDMNCYITSTMPEDELFDIIKKMK